MFKKLNCFKKDNRRESNNDRYYTCALRSKESEKNHPQFFAIYNKDIALLSALIEQSGIDQAEIEINNSFSDIYPFCIVDITEYAILKLGVIPECIHDHISDQDFLTSVSRMVDLFGDSFDPRDEKSMLRKEDKADAFLLYQAKQVERHSKLSSNNSHKYLRDDRFKP